MRIINIIGICTLAMAGAVLTLSEIALAQAGASQKLNRDGVAVDFDLKPLAADGNLREGEFADVQFRVTDSASGQPLSGVAPGAWIDAQALAADQAQG
ncbi:MAG: cytochrome D1, partial [Pseudomonas sp.]